MMNKDKLICCGGKHDYEKQADIYDFNKKQMFQINNMNEERRCSGICMDHINKNRVYVGGGWSSPKKFEYYDIMKDEWISLCDMKGTHKYWPCIFNDGNNPNIINIGSIANCKILEQIDIRENKWNDYIINEKKSFDELFATEIPKHDIRSRLLFSRHIY